MVDESVARDASQTAVGVRTQQALAALLGIDPTDAERVRDRSPSRRRPRRQRGPLLDLGDDSVADDRVDGNSDDRIDG